MMNISEVKRNDIDGLLALTTKVVNESVDVLIDDKQKIIKAVHSNIKTGCDLENCVFLKYQENNKSIGFVLVKNYWNFSDLFILPSKQRKGIGNKLAKKAIIICKDKTTKPNIRVNSSLNVVKFYKQLGFVGITIRTELPIYVIPLEFRF